MTDLTDKWNKGKLPEGDYYIKRRNGDLPYDNIDSKGVWRNSIDEDIVEVLAPVPSYEEWQASENYIDYLKQCISVYESKDKQATETSIAYNELVKKNEELKEILERHKKATAKAQIRSCDLEIINQQLKELLKECFEYIDWTDGTGSPISQQKLLDKIDEALK